MAYAVFTMLKITTASETETDCSFHPTFLSADLVAADPTPYPIAVPATGADPDNYSYEVWLKLECTSPPDSYCQNFRFYGPGQRPDYPDDKLTIYAGTTDTYATPVDSQSTKATTRQDTNYYSSAPSESLLVPVVPGDDKIEATGEQTEFLVLQLGVDFGAAGGAMATLPFTITYEEV